MRNPFTFQVESYSGAIFMLLIGAFFTSFLYIAIKNFNSDLDVLDAQGAVAHIKTISPTQRLLMESWMRDNNIELPEGKNLRWLLTQYPNRPWLQVSTQPQPEQQ
jgi:hypothetical protein